MELQDATIADLRQRLGEGPDAETEGFFHNTLTTNGLKPALTLTPNGL